MVFACNYCSVFFVELTKYLLSIPGVPVFMSKRLSKDPIDKLFGQHAATKGSSNDNPNVPQFVKGTQALKVINTTSMNIKGNC